MAKILSGTEKYSDLSKPSSIGRCTAPNPDRHRLFKSRPQISCCGILLRNICEASHEDLTVAVSV